MTQSRYGETRPSPALWKVLLTALAALAGPPAAAVAAFVGAITWSGCFIECSSYDQGDPVGGGLLLALAAVLAVSGPVLAAVLLRSWRAVLATIAVPAVLGGLLLLG